ncbi:MAG: hypothetical protein Tsb0013_14560 [Phycisphaerales bacterium]
MIRALRVVVPFALALIATGCASSETGARTRDEAAYRTSLESILADDQRYRSAIAWGTTDEAELERLRNLDMQRALEERTQRRAAGIALDPALEDELMAKQIELDILNTQRLIDLIQRYGWPTEATVGTDFPNPTPVLIHMRPEDVDRVLPLLRRETLEGRMPPKQYAMIVDRKRQHDGQPQLYGTAQAFDPETRTILAPAIVDIDATNRARAEIGLPPLTEFRTTRATEAAGG